MLVLVLLCPPHLACSPAEAAGTIDWEDPLGKELNTSGIKAYGRAKLQVRLRTLSWSGTVACDVQLVKCWSIIHWSLFGSGHSQSGRSWC